MTRQLFINGIEIDLKGDERIATTYQASPVADLPAANGFFSVEFDLPFTNNNRKAFGLPYSLPNSSDIPFSLLDCQYLEEGIDMKIDFAAIVSVTESEYISVRLYGGFSSLLSKLSNKTIKDIDLTQYDHIRNATNIAAALQGSSGYLYPMINYLDDISGDNVPIESLYPSVFLHTVFDRMLADAGYTLEGDLATNDDYLSLLLPFSNKQGEYSAAFLAALKSKMFLSAPVTVDGDVKVDRFPFDSELNDPFDLIWDAPFKIYHSLIRASYEVQVKCRIQGTPAASVTLMLCRSTIDFNISFFPFASVEPFEGIEVVNSWTVSGTDFGTGTAVINETVGVDLTRGQKLFLLYSKNSAEVTFNDGSTTTYLEITDVTNYGIFIGDTWQIAPNLPNIKQRDFLKFIMTTFAAIGSIDNESKVLTLTAFEDVRNNIERDDWTNKLDLSVKPEINYSSSLAQLNTFEYKDDENIIKPEGADYSFAVNNQNLESEKVFYSSPFGVTLPVQEFTDAIDIPRIDITSNQLKPRILAYKAVTLSNAINLQLGGVTQSIEFDIAAPYFIDPAETFNLGFATNLIPRYSAARINTLTRPRILTAYFRLTAKDINQLDFTKPVWIERYNSYFYKKQISQFESGKSTKCELIEI